MQVRSSVPLARGAATSTADGWQKDRVSSHSSGVTAFHRGCPPGGMKREPNLPQSTGRASGEDREEVRKSEGFVPVRREMRAKPAGGGGRACLRLPVFALMEDL